MADGFVPRKRKRPALSCETCRKRKVKCDRQVPCGPCTLAKTSVCIYSPEPSAVVRDRRKTDAKWQAASKSPQTTPSRDSVHILQQHITPALTPASSQRSPASNVVPQVESPPNDVDKNIEARAYDARGLIKSDKNYCLQESTPDGPHGRVSKTRFFGQSHWMNSITATPFNLTRSFKYSLHEDEDSDVALLAKECKSMARCLKADRSTFQCYPSNFRSFVPPRDVADLLLELYLRTLETVYRVLHVPSFRAQYAKYWEDPLNADISFVMQLLVILAIGACFFEDQGGAYRKLSATWIYTAQAWLNSPMEKSRLNLTGLRVNCLLLIARQTNAVGGDLIWISAGSLLRFAMHMGLHADPSSFPKIDPCDGEMRRRLWATILEILLQSSLDAGMPPMISSEDFSCRCPSNLDDLDLSAGTSQLPKGKTRDTFTDSTIQIMLVETWPSRLAVAKKLNHFKSDTFYDETLQLDKELQAALKAASNAFRVFLSSETGSRPTDFQIRYHDLLTRRFLLSLHRNFANKGITNPAFYYSRKVCQDEALILLEPCLKQVIQGLTSGTDDYIRLAERSGGLFRGVFIIVGTAIAFELLSQLQEDYQPPLPTPVNAEKQTLYQALQTVVEFTKRRLMAGETNVKSVLFMSGILGQADALIAGRSQEELLRQAGVQGLRLAHATMKEKTKLLRADTSAVPADTGSVSNDLFTEGSGIETSFEPDPFEYDMLLQQNLGLDFGDLDSWLTPGTAFPF